MAATTEKLGILSRVAKLIPHPCNANQVNRNFRESQRALDDISNIEIIGNDNIDVTCTVDPVTGNNQINLNFNAADPAISVSYDWDIRGDSGLDTIDDGNILKIAGGTGISTALTSSNGTKILTVTNTAAAVEAKWAICQTNWEKAGTPACTHVSVKDTDDCVATAGGTGTAFDVILPEVSGKDPNLVGTGTPATSDVIAYIDAEDGTKVCVSDYLDDKILSMKNWLGAAGDIPDGWAKMDGTANSVGNGGSGLDITTGGRYIRGKIGATAVAAGDTTGSTTHNHGGVVGSTAVSLDSVAVTIDNKTSLSTNDSTTGLSVATHPLHAHNESVNINVDRNLDGSTASVWDANARSAREVNDRDGIVTTLTHTVVEGSGHQHTIPNHNHTSPTHTHADNGDVGHSHSVNLDSHVPISHSVHWIERIDNSGP